MRHTRLTVVSTIALACIATPSFAATIVKVIEGGEGGGPMTLTLDQSTVRAGDTIFTVRNDAMTEEHEMVLVKLKSAHQKIPYIDAKQRIDETHLKSIGEVSDLKPGAGHLEGEARSGGVSPGLQY